MSLKVEYTADEIHEKFIKFIPSALQQDFSEKLYGLEAESYSNGHMLGREHALDEVQGIIHDADHDVARLRADLLKEMDVKQ